MKTSISEKARVGVMTVGHREYWEWNQFPGMKENLIQIGREIADCIAETGVEVFFEFVDNREGSYEAGLRLKEKNIDLLFLHVTTYAASGRWVQGALAAGCPIVVVGSQHWKDTSGVRNIDADEGNSAGGPCGFPEAYHALMRCGKTPAGLIFGIHIDDRFRNDLHEWAKAANAVHAFKGVAFGFMGHTYEGMLDMNFDPTSVTRVMGSHVKMVEMCELVDYIEKCTEEEVQAKIEEIKENFELKPRSYERMTADIKDEDVEWAAKVAVGLDKLVENNNLSGLVYYYMGENDSIYERAASNLIIGNSLMTTKGISMAGEADMKTCLAMYLTSALGCGGSFSELCFMGFDYNHICVGHDGPHDIRIAQGKPWIRGLGFMHGKKGHGISVEFPLKFGPISMVALTQDANCNFKLVYAEGESVEGWIAQQGNSLTRADFGMDIRDFIVKWVKAGVTHHAALAIGHCGSMIEKFGALMNIPVEKIC